MAGSITVRSAAADDFDQIAELANGRFGEGYLEKPEFLTWLAHPKLFLVAELDGQFCGYVYLMPEDREELAASMQLSEEYIRSVAGDKPVIHCRSAALRKDMEHKGAMYTLLRQTLTAAGEEGYGAAFAPAWKYNGHIPMEKLMQKLGYTYVGIRKLLWYQIPGYKCVICGGRCTCDAAVYSIALPADFS